MALTPRRTLIALAAVLGADAILTATKPPVLVDGILDELAHAATAVILLAALRLGWERRTLLAVALASVLIDVDHIPGALGHWVLGPEHARPYSHTLLLPVLIALAALVTRGDRRVLLVAVAFGFAAHLLRDLGEPGPGSSGAPVLWPFSRQMYALGYPLYGAMLAAAWAAAALRVNARRKMR